MARFRRDESETTEHGQTPHFARWMGGPTLAAIENCDCEDDKRRTVEVTGDADSAFSIPAKTRAGGKHVSGFVTSKDGRYYFTATGRNRYLIRSATAERLPDGRNASIGQIVTFPPSEYGSCGIGRVVGLAERDGCGAPYVDAEGMPIRRLIVLALSTEGSHAYIRHVAPADVDRVMGPHASGEFAAWFFAGQMPDAATVERMCRVGVADAAHFPERERYMP